MKWKLSSFREISELNDVKFANEDEFSELNCLCFRRVFVGTILLISWLIVVLVIC